MIRKLGPRLPQGSTRLNGATYPPKTVAPPTTESPGKFRPDGIVTGTPLCFLELQGFRDSGLCSPLYHLTGGGHSPH